MPSKSITKRQEMLVRSHYQRGMTGPKIATLLQISMKQVYDSLRRQMIVRKSSSEQNRILFESKPLSFSFKSKLSAKERELLVAAVMLYYGEGAKTGTTVDLVNSDKKILKVFLKFLRDICRVNESRLRCYLYCFSDQDANTLIDFWSSYLGVEQAQFTKPYVRSTLNKGTRTMPHGVIHLRYSDKKLLQKILSLISEVTSSLA